MSLFKEQKDAKLKVEEVAVKILEANNLKNLLDFLEFLKINKLTPRWQSYNSWSVRYKNKAVCYINLNDQEKFWRIRHSQFTRERWFVDYDKYFTDEEFKNYILDNIASPPCIGRGCLGRQNMIILGKHFDAVCNCWPMIIKDPEGEVLDYAKKFILVIKSFISDIAA